MPFIWLFQKSTTKKQLNIKLQAKGKNYNNPYIL